MLPRADKSNEKEEKKEDCLQKCIKVKWTDKRRTQPSTLKQSLAWGRDVFKASLLPKKQNKSGSSGVPGFSNMAALWGAWSFPIGVVFKNRPTVFYKYGPAYY